MTMEASPGDSWPRGYAVVAVLAIVVLLAPLLWTEYLPFVDYPNHVARIYIRAHYSEIPLLQQMYNVHYGLAPYLGMDVIATALAHFMNVYLACRLFVAILILLFCLGCHMLATTIRGHATWVAPISFFWVYNSSTLWGFLNYMVGVSLFLITLALWLKWREGWTPLTLAGFAMLAALCYFSHLTSYMFLGIVITVTSLIDVWKARIRLGSAISSVAPALFPMGFFLLWKQDAHESFRLTWNTLYGKLAAAGTVVRGYDLKVDAVFVAAWVVLLAVLFLSSKRRVHWPMLLSGLALLLVYVVLPVSVAANDDGSGIDGRFVLPGLLLLCFSVQLEVSRKVAAGAVAAALVLCVAHLATIEMEWYSLSGQIAEATSLFSNLPEAARVYPAIYRHTGADAVKVDVSLSHVLEYAIPEKRIYDPGLFEVGGLLEIREHPNRFRWSPGMGMEPLRAYEYIWSYAEPAELRELLSQEAVKIGDHAGVTLWKLHR